MEIEIKRMSAARIIKKAEARRKEKVLKFLNECWEEAVSSLIGAESTKRTIGYLNPYSTFNSERNGL